MIYHNQSSSDNRNPYLGGIMLVRKRAVEQGSRPVFGGSGSDRSCFGTYASQCMRSHGKLFNNRNQVGGSL